MKTHAHLKKLQNGLGLLLLLSLTACVNLQPIRQFAGNAADAASYTALTTYYLDSFDHQKNYQDEKFHAALDKESAARHQQEAALLALHRGIEAYMGAIGALASDELVSYDTSLTRLAGELKDSKLVPESKVDAYKDVTAFIAKAATDAYRQRKLKQLIAEANAPFQQVVEALKEIVGRGYVQSLDNEIENLDNYYKEVIKESETSNSPPALVEMVKETWRTKRDDLIARKKACQAYAETLGKIAEGHGELCRSQDKLDAKATLDTITAYSKDLNDLRGKIKELTK